MFVLLGAFFLSYEVLYLYYFTSYCPCTYNYAFDLGYAPVVIERGQPVERRGRDIGALLVRRVLDPESNLCFGEVLKQIHS